MTSNSHDNATQDFDRRYTVGADLRMAREERGLQIRDVVDAVRIQARYLEALEDGRVEDLPGTVYALGFVRTYADYLGLDGAEMVGRFKEEAKGLQTQEYVLPEPIDEGKVPTTAIIIIAVLLAGLAYGGWHFLYRSEAPIADLVPDVPDRLAALVPPEEATAPAADVTPSEQTSEPAAVQLQPGVGAVQSETPPPVTAEPPPVTAEPPPVTAEQPPVTAEQPPAVVEEQPPQIMSPQPAEETPPVPQPAPVTQVQPAATEPPAQEMVPETASEPAPQEAPNVAIAEPAPPSPAPEPADTGSAVVPETPPPPSPPAEPVSREPRVFGSDNADARIVINANEDAWVEVTDADGALLFSRVLRVGDSYRVPDRPGAVFVTGNAGGLSIVVDGENVPRIGPAGVVRRNVRLDPEQLKAGTAWP